MVRFGRALMWGIVIFGGLGQADASDGGRRTDHRFAQDRVTEGWVLTFANPDGGERIAGTLVIARRGKIVRRIDGDAVIRSWAFWSGGREVAVELGGMHGPSRCALISVQTGKAVGEVADGCDTPDAAAPEWVRALGR